MEKHKRPFTLFSSKASKVYTDIAYSPDHLLIFGSETTGLPKTLWDRWPGHFAHIPMLPGNRCLNLANAAAVVAYEAVRQQGLR